MIVKYLLKEYIATHPEICPVCLTKIMSNPEKKVYSNGVIFTNILKRSYVHAFLCSLHIYSVLCVHSGEIARVEMGDRG